MNLSNALSQQQNITQSGISMNNMIQGENNESMRSYHTALTTLKGNDSKEDDVNLGKIAGYTVAGLEKIHEYKSAVKAGTVGEGIGGSKLATRTGKVGNWLVDSVSDSPAAYVGPEDTQLEGMAKLAKANAAAGGDLSQTGQGAAPEELGGTITSEPGDANFEGATGDVAGGAGDVAGGTDLAGEAGQGAAKAGASTLEETGSVLARAAPKVLAGVETAGKVVGGLASLAVLGDDIGNQISKKKFFYGENTGDNIGNTTNEIGSAMDVIGVATGDPFLIMAGVGVGAIGALTSDISEFLHHKTQEKTKTDTPPADVKAVAQTNIASAGYIAQTAPSSLQQVQIGAS